MDILQGRRKQLLRWMDKQVYRKSKTISYGTIHLGRQHVFGGEGCPHGPMVKRSQYIRFKNPLHKHFSGNYNFKG